MPTTFASCCPEALPCDTGALRCSGRGRTAGWGFFEMGIQGWTCDVPARRSKAALSLLVHTWVGEEEVRLRSD